MQIVYKGQIEKWIKENQSMTLIFHKERITRQILIDKFLKPMAKTTTKKESLLDLAKKLQ